MPANKLRHILTLRHLGIRFGNPDTGGGGVGDGTGIVDLVAESTVDEPGAVGFAGLEYVFDYFHAGGEEDGDGG
eukprot:CAMPEP_0198263650 /NCGR_PEP_ID=MMETSP1447-20131203/13074_1 /TAXON_ID=420782 /ORGANISM="Chaetoceros dichaeta, Strain CCMP1751" /LENGTH=73 /DNA_ID=CAMNT_0043952337 /DNA_START=84 /DNA_END=305 /DNA_ORIENTATION=+